MGRPKLLTPEQEEQGVERALLNPRFPARELAAIREQVGKPVSRRTLRDLLKKKIISGNESS